MSQGTAAVGKHGAPLEFLACLSLDALVLGKKCVRWRDPLRKGECHLLAPAITTKSTSQELGDSTVTEILLSILVFSLDSQITFPWRFIVLRWLERGLIPY